MREILFRGKTKSGMWVYGYYMLTLIRGEKAHVIAPLTSHMDVTLDKEQYIIDPETVGQYTGMTDRNGKKIFEGDICLGVLKTRFEVYWDKERTAFMAREKHDVPYGRDIDYYASYSDGKIGAEVIGNIYDNPELLNEV